MAPAQDERDPLDEMLRFHDVVRRQLENMRAIAAALQGWEVGAMARARALADEVVRELGLKRILHERDEVESLLPRLLAKVAAGLAEDAELAEQLAHLAREHQEWEAAWRPIQFWLWMVSVEDPIVSAEELAAACTVAEQQLLGHAEAEERTLYRAARELLSAADLAAIAREMQERRSRFAAPPPHG
jgi:hypothetical protein